MCDDFVSDVMRKLRDHIPSLCQKKSDHLEKEIRQHWGGDRAYIGKTRFDREVRDARDGRIFRDHQKGERVALLARRYKLSPRWIRQIIKQKTAEAKIRCLKRK